MRSTGALPELQLMPARRQEKAEIPNTRLAGQKALSDDGDVHLQELTDTSEGVIRCRPDSEVCRSNGPIGKSSRMIGLDDASRI